MTTTDNIKTAENLDKLADYIQDSVPNSDIMMAYYFGSANPRRVMERTNSGDFVKHNRCGTVACALGHAVSMFPVLSKHFDDICRINETFNINRFAITYFPALYSDDNGEVTYENDNWRAVFSSDLDPTKSAVVKRLRDKAIELLQLTEQQ